MEGPARQAQVSRAFEGLEKAIESLDQTLRGYGDRLNPILAPTPPIGSSCGQLKEKELLAPVATRITAAGEKVQALESYVQGLITRTEI